MLLKSVICEEDKLKEICDKLNELIREILHMDVKFSFYGSKEDGYYNIHNKIKSKEDRRFDLNLRLYRNEENEDFLYAYILWFAVNPKKVGVGSNVIKNVIEILKEYTDIEMIIIHPKDKEVKNFWIKNNFQEDSNRKVLDKRIKINTRRTLSYYIYKSCVEN